LGDEELVEVGQRVRLAHRAQVELDEVALDVAGGQLGVLPLDLLEDLLGRQVVGGQPAGVDPDADVAGAEAAELDAAHVADGGQLRLQLLLGEVADAVERHRPGQGQPHHGEVVRVDLGDDGRVDVKRELAAGAADGVLDVLHGDVDVPRQAEVDGDDAGAFEALRHDVIDALDAGDGVLD